MPDYKQEVRSLQSKKQEVLGAAAVGKQDKRNIVIPPPPMPGNTGPDVLRAKYVKILQHDFTGQDWIVRNKERRDSINRNYKIVTGATRDLNKSKRASRRDEVEQRRVLSLSASSKLVDHIVRRDRRKDEWDELDKGAIAGMLMSKTAEDFNFASDEEFLASFDEKMSLLSDAQLLSHDISQGEELEGFSAGELNQQLALLDQIRKAYENRIQIISSPYYLSIREEDLTEPTMERLDHISRGWIEADESLKSYAEAVVGWKTSGEKLLSDEKKGKNVARKITVKEASKKTARDTSKKKTAKDEEEMPEIYRAAMEKSEVQDSPEMLDIRNKITMLQNFLDGSMPPFAKTLKEEEGYREELGGTRLAVNLMYNKLIESIDTWLDRKDTVVDASPERLQMLTRLREQALHEESLFAQSLKTYRDRMIGSDLAKRGVASSWAEMLRYQRSDKIDIDEDPKCMTMAGAHSSNVMKIKKNGKTWYFKEEENLVTGGNAEIADQIAPKVKTLDPKVLKGFKAALAMEDNKDIGQKVLRPIFNAMLKEKDYLAKVKKRKGPLAEFIQKMSKNQQESFRDFYILFCRARTSKSGSSWAGIGQGRNLSRRNVATSRLAGILGIDDMIADSRTAEVKYQGKVISGNLMDEADGVAVDKALKSNVSGYSAKAEDQLLMLQIYDLLCGQVDRHIGNYMVNIKGNKIDGIKCIDNDMAFGKLSFATARKGRNQIRPLTSGAIRALPAGFRKKILALNKEYMNLILRDLLEPDELEGLADRLAGLQRSIMKEERLLAEEAEAASTRQEKREILDPELNKLKYLRSLKQGDGRTDKISMFIDHLLDERDLNKRISTRQNKLRK